MNINSNWYIFLYTNNNNKRKINTDLLLGISASDLVKVQSMAWSVAFSSGSPTNPSSSWINEWQVASAWSVSTGTWVSGCGVVGSFSSNPAMPSTTKLSLVSVPVLSKQHISMRPANGIRKGSVQYTPSLVKETKDVLTASDNSMGSSGGTTDVRISVHSRKSL